MVFSSYIFLYYFLPLFLMVYFASPKEWRSVIIAVSSYIFYGWWMWWFVLLMLFSTVVDFYAGKRITAARESGGRGRRWLLLSCVSNLGLLGYFKYANFFVDSFNQFSTDLGIGPIEWASVILPVGISFYTFQTMSYTIDVFRGEAPKVRRFVDFMCYVAMFPQLVAGPIVRYSTIADQLAERRHTWTQFGTGVVLFQIGLAKKILIADNVAPLADAAFGAEGLSAPDAWIGLLAYTFQIYYDFSGYSDMAIGLGLMMGFTFPINFDQPYRSVGITDFWRRWHISLSTWLRDYLYKPLGGNRKGVLRTYINLALVMLLGGLWHGANWTFIAWGAYQGFWLIVERLFGKRSIYGWMPKPGQVLGTFVLAMFGWVFFRAESLSKAGDYFRSLFALDGLALDSALQFTPVSIAAMAAAFLVTWTCPKSQQLAKELRFWFILVLQVLFLAALAHLHYQVHVPFIYFQF